MRTVVAALALVFAVAPTHAQDVDVGKVNWSKFPALKEKPSRLDYAQLAERVSTVLSSGQCQIKGASPRRFDITVPYAVLVEPNGKAARVVVSEMNCTGLETMVGEAVLARSDAGDFLPTGEGKARWYVSAVNFTLR
jgi:hypothetical protein